MANIDTLVSNGTLQKNRTIFKDIQIFSVPQEVLDSAGYKGKKGMYFPNQKKIFLSESVEPRDRLTVFCHELAHHKQALEGRNMSSEEIEIEANKMADEYCPDWMDLFGTIK